MKMSLTEVSLNIPTDHMANVFGQFDVYIKKIERTLNVTVVVRGEDMKILGDERRCRRAQDVFMQLLELSKRGNVITEQNVNYALALIAEEKESAIVEIDRDCICHTINGKPVKPKTLGQKAYVDAIREKMIVFGMGPVRLIWRWRWQSPRLKMRRSGGLSSPGLRLRRGRSLASFRAICRARLILT